MTLYQDSQLSIYFGDASMSFNGDSLRNNEIVMSSDAHYRLQVIQKELCVDQIFFLKQTHSTLGKVIGKDVPSSDREEGDFLITQALNTGLGVYTADCLPIILHDPVRNALGVCHAGWIGSVNEIAVRALQQMQKYYESDPTKIRIFFGPSAKTCCYEVQSDFIKNVQHFAFKDQVLIQRNSKLYFDVPGFNQLLLEEQGISSDSFINTYNVCTICDTSFCSNRRSKGSKDRQVTIVTLK